MSEIKIQLNPSNIWNIPLQIYENDFTFIVNGEEFKTSRLISDILSQNISRIHSTDPSFDKYIINTHYSGDFSYILDLINFEKYNIPENELPFICEVIRLLGNTSIYISSEEENTEITLDNAFQLLQKHILSIQFYSKSYKKDIEFISSHFYELCEMKEEDLLKLDDDTLFSILSHERLQLKEEDQLLHFINKLYMINTKYSTFYQIVYFLNVSSIYMTEFIEICNSEDMTKEIWLSLSERLKMEVKKKKNDINNIKN